MQQIIQIIKEKSMFFDLFIKKKLYHLEINYYCLQVRSKYSCQQLQIIKAINGNITIVTGRITYAHTLPRSVTAATINELSCRQIALCSSFTSQCQQSQSRYDYMVRHGQLHQADSNSAMRCSFIFTAQHTLRSSTMLST